MSIMKLTLYINLIMWLSLCQCIVLPWYVRYFNIYWRPITEKTQLMTDGILRDDSDKSTAELIKENGYPVEEHAITTVDGYILLVHRIPACKRKNTVFETTNAMAPVFLQHGLLSSSLDWVMQPPHRSLAYMLADRGYDVWLGNARGNTYSRRHINMTSDDADFWKFTWNEMGQFDLPAVIDYILENTAHSKLIYVGHSMGTTMFWVLLHYHPQYNDKILKMHSLAPIAKVTHMRSAVRLIAPFANDIEVISEWFGANDFLPGHGWIEYVAKHFCRAQESTRFICDNLVFLLAGSDTAELNKTSLPVILSHTPAGTSTRTVVHYAQELNGDHFCHYDWGSQENLKRYGQSKPPPYDLAKVTCPVALYTADNDILAVKEDIDWLNSRLINVKQRYRISMKTFNHVDFMWAVDADTLVYDFLLNNIK